MTRKTAIATVGSLTLVLALSIVARGDDSKRHGLAVKMATLFRAARAVISDNQAHINDASKGDKGLSPQNVVSKAKKNFENTSGGKLSADSDFPLDGQAQNAMIAAIEEVMANAQPLINEEGKGFKGFLPAVFAKQVADAFSKNMDGKMSIKLTAPKSYVRNRRNRPDKWEHNVIEQQFKSSDWKTGTEFAETAPHKGKKAYRLMIPEYYKASCLKCHGEPKGSRDIPAAKWKAESSASWAARSAS